MKFVAVCLLLVVYGVVKSRAYQDRIPEEIRGMIAGVREKCHRETGVDIEHVDRTVEGYFHPSERLGCYFSCVFNHFELLDHDGHLDFNKVATRIPESFKDHALEMVNKCKHTTGDNPCDSAFKIVQCFQQANPEKFFVI